MDNSKFTILVVDDSPENITILESLLVEEGYGVITATGGDQALSKVRQDAVDLILLDVMMPVMDGFETCRRLKADVGDIPVIFITGKGEIDDIIQGFKAGAVDYILRPFNIAELFARVHTHIELRFSKQIIDQQVASLKETNRQLLRTNGQLSEAMEEIQTLKGLLCFCSHCRRIQKPHTDPTRQKSWVELETYICEHTPARVSHALCPQCFSMLYPDYKQSNQQTGTSDQ
jgi:DNA-binding response OmpR family regulator